MTPEAQRDRLLKAAHEACALIENMSAALAAGHVWRLLMDAIAEAGGEDE